MKRMFLLFAVVVAMLCSATLSYAQNAQAPQRHGWGYPYYKIDPCYSQYFQPLYGDVESVTIKVIGFGTVEDFCFPFPLDLITFVFNTRGDVVTCMGQDSEGEEKIIRAWSYDDKGQVITFYSNENYTEQYVTYVYDSSAQLVGASVKGSSYNGEFCYTVSVNQNNRAIIDLFGIDFTYTWRENNILYRYSNKGKISPVANITDRDLSELAQEVIAFVDGDNNGVIDVKNIFYIDKEVSFGRDDIIYAGSAAWGEFCLYSFDSSNKLMFEYCGSPRSSSPPVTKKYKYDANGRLVTRSDDFLNQTFVYEYDDAGRLVGKICYEPKYSNDDENKIIGHEPCRVSNYVYDSHGNLIRIETKHLKNSYQEERYSSIEYLIRYRK